MDVPGETGADPGPRGHPRFGLVRVLISGKGRSPRHSGARWQPSSTSLGVGHLHDHALEPLWMLRVDGDRVVGALAVLSKPLGHRGQDYTARGLSTVVTDAALRGRGYGGRLVGVVRALIESSGADLGIFTGDRHLQGFYEGAGWELLPGAVLVGGTPEAPLASDSLDKVTLAAFFSPHASAHRDDFTGARIELYPGRIDRLW